MEVRFRASCVEDVDSMVQIAEEGRAFLKSCKVSQWQRGTYPDRPLFLQDILDGIGYVLTENGQVVSICAVTFTEEPSYRSLLSGSWLTDDMAVYATIHRMAVSALHRGKNLAGHLFSSVEEMGRERHASSIRIDTHPDNHAMQKALEKAGFTLCGTFRILDGDEAGDLRLAYEKLI